MYSSVNVAILLEKVQTSKWNTAVMTLMYLFLS